MDYVLKTMVPKSEEERLFCRYVEMVLDPHMPPEDVDWSEVDASNALDSPMALMDLTAAKDG